MTTPRAKRRKTAYAVMRGEMTPEQARDYVDPPKTWGGKREGAGRQPAGDAARTHVLRVRLTPSEHAALVERAGGEGQVSEWVRSRLLGE